MNIQEIFVLAFVAAAVIYVASMIYKKARSFSPKKGCADDCGCSSAAKEPTAAA
jgi:hypothetical protein